MSLDYPMISKKIYIYILNNKTFIEVKIQKGLQKRQLVQNFPNHDGLGDTGGPLDVSRE